MKADPAADPTDAAGRDATLREIALLNSVPADGASAPPRHWTRRLRDGLDARLHAWRRRRALSRLSRGGGVESILFVCIGNIYRSPFAAAAFTAALPAPLRGLVRCASAGFTGADRSTPGDAIEAAAARSIDLRSHRSALLTPERVARAKLIVVMDAEQRRGISGRFGRRGKDVLILGDLDPEPIETRGIRDPWDQPREVLHASYDRIQRCARELARVVVAG